MSPPAAYCKFIIRPLRERTSKSAHDCGVVLEKIQGIFTYHTHPKQQQQQHNKTLGSYTPCQSFWETLFHVFFRKQAIPEEIREEAGWMSLTHKPLNHNTCDHPRTYMLQRLQDGSHKNKSSLPKAWLHLQGPSVSVGVGLGVVLRLPSQP